MRDRLKQEEELVIDKIISLREELEESELRLRKLNVVGFMIAKEMGESVTFESLR